MTTTADVTHMAQDTCPHCGRSDTSAGTRLYSPQELAQRWDEDEVNIRKWIRLGYLRSQKIGPYHKVPGQEVDRFELNVLTATSAL